MRIIVCALVLSLAACGSDAVAPVDPCCASGAPAIRIVNAFASPVDVIVDGQVRIAALPAGIIDTLSADAGSHVLELRQTGAAVSVSGPVTTTSGALTTIAVVRASNGSVASAMLDDTNSIVPSGATKVRVLHLATTAGTLQVFRTQPDFQTPIAWQFPFTYQAQPTSLSAPFYQSTVGTWEVRVWQSPADASGWVNAPLRILVPLESGQKRTILLLDKPGGGVRAELL